MDDRTRLWNDRGLLRRAEELLAGTIRDRSAIGAAVVDIDGDGLRNDWALGDRVAEGLRRSARLSDAVGRIGTAQFGVVAPRTGARRALLAHLSSEGPVARPWRICYRRVSQK